MCPGGACRSAAMLPERGRKGVGRRADEGEEERVYLLRGTSSHQCTRPAGIQNTGRQISDEKERGLEEQWSFERDNPPPASPVTDSYKADTTAASTTTARGRKTKRRMVSFDLEEKPSKNSQPKRSKYKQLSLESHTEQGYSFNSHNNSSLLPSAPQPSKPKSQETFTTEGCNQSRQVMAMNYPSEKGQYVQNSTIDGRQISPTVQAGFHETTSYSRDSYPRTSPRRTRDHRDQNEPMYGNEQIVPMDQPLRERYDSTPYDRNLSSHNKRSLIRTSLTNFDGPCGDGDPHVTHNTQYTDIRPVLNRTISLCNSHVNTHQRPVTYGENRPKRPHRQRTTDEYSSSYSNRGQRLNNVVTDTDYFDYKPKYHEAAQKANEAQTERTFPNYRSQGALNPKSKFENEFSDNFADKYGLDPPRGSIVAENENRYTKRRHFAESKSFSERTPKPHGFGYFPYSGYSECPENTLLGVSYRSKMMQRQQTYPDYAPESNTLFAHLQVYTTGENFHTGSLIARSTPALATGIRTLLRPSPEGHVAEYTCRKLDKSPTEAHSQLVPPAAQRQQLNATRHSIFQRSLSIEMSSPTYDTIQPEVDIFVYDTQFDNLKVGKPRLTSSLSLNSPYDSSVRQSSSPMIHGNNIEEPSSHNTVQPVQQKRRLLSNQSFIVHQSLDLSSSIPPPNDVQKEDRNSVSALDDCEALNRIRSKNVPEFAFKESNKNSALSEYPLAILYTKLEQATHAFKPFLSERAHSVETTVPQAIESSNIPPVPRSNSKHLELPKAEILIQRMSPSTSFHSTHNESHEQSQDSHTPDLHSHERKPNENANPDELKVKTAEEEQGDTRALVCVDSMKPTTSNVTVPLAKDTTQTDPPQESQTDGLFGFPKNFANNAMDTLRRAKTSLGYGDNSVTVEQEKTSKTSETPENHDDSKVSPESHNDLRNPAATNPDSDTTKKAEKSKRHKRRKVIKETQGTQTDDCEDLLKWLAHDSRSNLSISSGTPPTVLKHKVVFYQNRFIPVQAVAPVNTKSDGTSLRSSISRKSGSVIKDPSARGTSRDTTLESQSNDPTPTHKPLGSENPDSDRKKRAESTNFAYKKSLSEEQEDMKKDTISFQSFHEEDMIQLIKQNSVDKTVPIDVPNEEATLAEKKHKSHYHHRRIQIRHVSLQTDIQIDPRTTFPHLSKPIERPSSSSETKPVDTSAPKSMGSSSGGGGIFERVDVVFAKVVDMLQDNRGEPYQEVKSVPAEGSGPLRDPVRVLSKTLNYVFLVIGVILFSAVVVVILVFASR